MVSNLAAGGITEYSVMRCRPCQAAALPKKPLRSLHERTDLGSQDCVLRLCDPCARFSTITSGDGQKSSLQGDLGTVSRIGKRRISFRCAVVIPFESVNLRASNDYRTSLAFGRPDLTNVAFRGEGGAKRDSAFAERKAAIGGSGG